MKNCTECLLLSILSLVLCVTLTTSLPVSDTQRDMERITKIYNSLKLLQQKRNTYKSQKSDSNTYDNRGNSDDIGLFLAFGEPLRVSTDNRDEGQELQKRQGVWDFDYGLGGGRFGKRGFGDYSLGGGRFGRDVDHVDPDFSENE